MSRPRFVIYARKSTESEDRQVLSIDSQISELNTIAERRGFEVAEVLRESMSAKEPGRPVFNELMLRVGTGEIAGILCWKLDRLARNPIDGGSIIWAIKQKGVHIVTPSQTYAQADDNVILMYVEFGMAQKYIDDLGKNVKRGNRAKLQLGWLPGVAPIGYLNKLDDHTLIPDPVLFPLVRKVWDLYLGGSSINQILKIANQEWGFKTPQRKRRGGNPLGKSSLYRMLTNPFYYGLLERMDHGEKRQYTGKHQAMITEEEFFRVQRILGRLGVRRPQKKNFAYTGLMRCGECGCMITAEEKTKKSGRVYVYYRCTRRHQSIVCKNPPVTLSELENQVSEQLEKIRIPIEFKNWALGWYRQLNSAETVDRTVVVSSLQSAFIENEKQLGRLTDMRLKELLTDEEYVAKKNNLLEERNNLKAKLGDQDQRALNWLERTEKVYEFAVNAKSHFETGGPDERRKIFAALGGKLILQDKQLRLELDEIWGYFASHSKQLFMDVNRLELEKTPANNKELTDYSSVSSLWRVGRDLNP
ncbi:MAG: recombinase family protein [bacterium]